MLVEIGKECLSEEVQVGLGSLVPFAQLTKTLHGLDLKESEREREGGRKRMDGHEGRRTSEGTPRKTHLRCIFDGSAVGSSQECFLMSGLDQLNLTVDFDLKAAEFFGGECLDFALEPSAIAREGSDLFGQGGRE